MTTKQIRLRRGTTTEHQNFTGAPGEITFDTTKNTLRVHDGNLEAGHLIATESFVNGVFDDTVSLINSMAQGPKGDQGDTGPAGPAGPQGPGKPARHGPRRVPRILPPWPFDGY